MRKELLLVLCYFCLMLVGCSSDPYPDAPESVQGFVVPPYPGAAGRVGLDGVDSNNNGVRDDVERWILLEHGDKLDRRAIKMMFLDARSLQKALSSISSKEVARKFEVVESKIDTLDRNVIAQSLGGMPYSYSSEENRNLVRMITSDLIDQVVNTNERAEAYAHYNYLLGGGTYDFVYGSRDLELEVEHIRVIWDREDGVQSQPLDVIDKDWSDY